MHQRSFPSLGDAAKKAGATCATHHMKDRFAAEAIIETAKACGCDLNCNGIPWTGRLEALYHGEPSQRSCDAKLNSHLDLSLTIYSPFK
jgi:hypothetical protein